jgi:hypothetical protein
LLLLLLLLASAAAAGACCVHAHHYMCHCVPVHVAFLVHLCAWQCVKILLLKRQHLQAIMQQSNKQTGPDLLSSSSCASANYQQL